MANTIPKVLIVEDERGTADLYSEWLESDYDVRTAYDGASALEQISAQTDVVFLDRRMPPPTGDEVLEEIRERELDCQVAMLTAVEPDFDIIDLDFDDYLVKPVDKEELHATVDRFVDRQSLDDRVRRHLSLVAKQAALTSNKLDSDLETNEEYAKLGQQIANSRNELDASVSGDILVDFLLEETGDYLYVVVRYQPESWEYNYVSKSGEALVTELDEHIDEVLDVFRDESRRLGELESVIGAAGPYCSLQLFGGIVFINFGQSDGQGILCGFDPGTANHLTAFIERVLPYVRQAGLTELEADPTWITRNSTEDTEAFR